MESRLIDSSIYKNLPIGLKKLTSNFKGREKDIVLMSSLGVLSNCLPNIQGVYDGNTVYPHLYVLIVAPPASGKGVMNYSRILIEKIHQKILVDSKTEKNICEEDKKKNKRENNTNCPALEVKIVPANISTSELYSFMASSNHGLLIIESEADTLSNMLNNDWSNYSDVLRKCFHHEPISISRKIENVYEEIPEPKLSLVISGTSNQLQPLLKSRENGLFSRFIIYNFDEIANFKNVFELNTRNNKIIFDDLSNEALSFYDKLSKLDKPIHFELTENQQKRFLNTLGYIWDDIVEHHKASFLPSLNRHGLILFRICMILTAIRNKNELDKKSTLLCYNRDFLIALKLMQTLLRHSQNTFDTIETGILSIQDEGILDDLKDTFTRQEIIEVGEKKSIPNRTIDDKLVQFQRKRFIKKIRKGFYKKL